MIEAFTHQVRSYGSYYSTHFLCPPSLFLTTRHNYSQYQQGSYGWREKIFWAEPGEPFGMSFPLSVQLYIAFVNLGFLPIPFSPLFHTINRYLGMVTIILNDYPALKYVLIGIMGLFVLTNKESWPLVASAGVNWRALVLVRLPTLWGGVWKLRKYTPCGEGKGRSNQILWLRSICQFMLTLCGKGQGKSAMPGFTCSHAYE